MSFLSRSRASININNNTNNDALMLKKRKKIVSWKAIVALTVLFLSWFSSNYFQPAILQSLSTATSDWEATLSFSSLMNNNNNETVDSLSSLLLSSSNGDDDDFEWLSLLTAEQRQELPLKRKQLQQLAQQLYNVSEMDRTTVKKVGCCGGLKQQHGSTNKCMQTCFSSHVCQQETNAEGGGEMVYPFSSLERKTEFQPATGRVTDEFERWCKEELRTNPVATWCSPEQQQLQKKPKPGENNGNEKKDGNNTPSWFSPAFANQTMTHITTGCSMLSMGAKSGPFDRMILFPDAKLAFCGIPKVAITQWIKFLRYTIGAKDYQSLPHFKEDIKPLFFDELPHEKQLRILQDPSWTRAVFLRNPAERVLSAYLDKLKGKNALKQINMLGATAESFASFVQTLYTRPNPKCENQTGPSWCWDPHWRPQFYSCGLHALLPHFDFVGIMDSTHAANHTRALLHRVGLWESFGQSYSTSATPEAHGHTLCAILPPDPDNASSLVLRGFQQDLRAKSDRHTHDAQSKLDEHYNEPVSVNSTKTLLQLVQEMYDKDFILWNALTQQQQPSSKEARTWLTGQELLERLKPECSRIQR